jgi:hypothetical protein
MGWLTRFLRWLAPGSAPREHDFGGAIGKLPLLQPSKFIRLHVTADGRIQLDDRPVPIGDLERELTAAYRPGAVVSYSRENPGEDSEMGVKACECVCRLGLPIAFPAEATDTINQLYRKDE